MPNLSGDECRRARHRRRAALPRRRRRTSRSPSARSTAPATRFRVRVEQGQSGDLYVTALPLSDVDATIVPPRHRRGDRHARHRRRARRRDVVGDPARHPPDQADDAHGDGDRRRRPVAPGAADARHRPRPGSSAWPSTTCSRRSRRRSPNGRVAGPPAPVRRRRVARAAHPRHDHPRLRRAVPDRWPRRARRARRGDAADRAGGGAHGPARRRPPRPRQVRRGAAVRAPSGRPVRRSSPTPPATPAPSIPSAPITSDVDGPLVVSGDEDRLRQVIANVVGNALVHTARTSQSSSVSSTSTATRTDHGDRSRPRHVAGRRRPRDAALLPRRPGARAATVAAAGSGWRSPTPPSPPTAARSSIDSAARPGHHRHGDVAARSAQELTSSARRSAMRRATRPLFSRRAIRRSRDCSASASSPPS